MKDQREGVLEVDVDNRPYAQVRVGPDGAFDGFASVHEGLCSARHGNTKLTSFYHASLYFGFVPVEKVFGDEASPDFLKRGSDVGRVLASSRCRSSVNS